MKNSFFLKFLFCLILFISSLSSANGQFVSSSSSVKTKGQDKFIFDLNFGFGFHPKGDQHGFEVGGELGHLFKSPVFITLGGMYTEWTHYSPKTLYTPKIEVKNESILIPLNIGYVIGNWEKFNITFGGGVICNYALSSKINGESVKIPDSEKIIWNGDIRFTLGYAGYNVYAHYYKPFDSGDSGVWGIGFLMKLLENL